MHKIAWKQLKIMGITFIRHFPWQTESTYIHDVSLVYLELEHWQKIWLDKTIVGMQFVGSIVNQLKKKIVFLTKQNRLIQIIPSK
jgi:hypothetical protein